MKRLALLIALVLAFASKVDAQCAAGTVSCTLSNMGEVSMLLTGVNINSAGSDNAIAVPYPKYIIRRVTIYDASTSLAVSVATVGLFTGAGGTGTTLVTPATMTTLTASTIFVDSTLAVTNSYQTAQPLYVRNVLAHGSAATVSVKLEIQPLS